MVEEIITALSRIRWLLVVARNSSFTYKGQAIDVKQVGRELGVRYVLEGSMRKGGNRVRITGQPIDAVSGTHLWADRFDGLIEDVFELQDKGASSVAGATAAFSSRTHRQRSSRRWSIPTATNSSKGRMISISTRRAICSLPIMRASPSLGEQISAA
jgi:hypothetical protein